MSNQNLIIFKFIPLYDILEELSLNLNFKISLIEDENSLNKEIKNYNNYLVVSKKKYLNISNQLVIENKPIKIFKLIEKINIEFLKIKYNIQSQIKVKKYTINLNSREMFIQDIKLKLTEKEINTITYLSNSNKPVGIEELQKMVWGYQSDIETHTVETHIYRLRKKFLNTFNDNEFIISKKNGYKIK